MERLLNDVEDAIRAGRLGVARQKLAALNKTKVPRVYAIRVAALARRTNLPGLSIRVLNPIVRPSPRSQVTPEEKEKAEYAAALTKIGANQEALTILAHVDRKNAPQSLLYEAWARFVEWDYEASIPLLNEFVSNPSIDDYQKIVGQVNLAAALVHERKSTAAALLQELRESTHRQKYHLLFANVLELSAQYAIGRREWGKADKFLKEASVLIGDTGLLDAFFIKKWEAVLHVLRSKEKKTALRELRSIRKESSQYRHWETMRDCDRYESLVTRDENLLTHLLFGSPFEKFRIQLLADFGSEVFAPEQYLWELGGKSRQAPVLDVRQGKGMRQAFDLKQGQTVHRLLITLTSDFYRPIRLASLYGQVYPNEFFNPLSSPTRVRQLLKRLRFWLKESRLPLQIREDLGSYRLEAKAPCHILITRGEGGVKTSDYRFQKLKARFEKQPFSAQDAAQVLGISPRTALRFLAEAVSQKTLSRTGQAGKTRYRF